MKRLILLADDSQAGNQELAGMFQDTYTIVNASDEKELLDLMYEHKKNVMLVILAMNHPKIDCFYILEQAKKNYDISKIPIITILADDDSEKEVKAISLGAVDIIVKPYNIQLVEQRIRNLLSMVENSNYRAIAERDSLTHIYNKETFYEKATELIKRKNKTEYGIFCLDIDKFKLINELYGKEEGNKLLISIANRILPMIPKDSIVCRLQADQYAICAPVMNGMRLPVVDVLNKELEEYPLNLKIVIRCGMYPVGMEDISVAMMCDRALMAIETIKNSPTEHFSQYDEEIKKKVLFEEELVRGMQTALLEGQFQIYYQPKIHILTKEMIAAEALAYWNHPTFGPISPREYAPVFERNGFMASLDAYVWEQVCNDISGWLAEEIKPCPISVQVSKSDLYNYNLYEILYQLTMLFDIPVSLLQLEITELAYTDDPKQITDVVGGLKDLGFTILIDDFGSGYSSLNSLKDVSVDVLVIDLRCLCKSGNRDKTYDILESLVHMAKKMNLQVIAGGVDSEKQEHCLKEIGCLYAQGSYYQVPLEKEKFEERIR